ncbi:MAG: isohexenylglutaconyl-CoA hydratase [Oleiphilaceae bacterium]|jgi:isohexenylglutaconyl-CoA hydratase
MNLPKTETLLLEQKDHVLHVTLNRPKVKNAMSLVMVNELMAVFEQASSDLSIRAILLRGAEGNFCAGGDIKDMVGARAALSKKDNKEEVDPFYALNRAFGRMITYANQIPQVLIVVTEGAVLGGGFGLACISDVALSLNTTKFGLPETGLGIPPAQIAPFVVTRIGLTQARRLALLGARFDGAEALRLGIVHECHDNSEALEDAVEKVLLQVKRCAPQANRITKQLILSVGKEPLETLLDEAAKSFAEAVQSAEGQEGTMAFIQKRDPSWFN